MTADDVRFGVLGAANILGSALVKPARQVDGVTVRSIAARNPERARKAAARAGIPVTHNTYEDVLADPGINAVYIPLPPSHHGEWAIRAIEAGKHVLVEKPFTANAEEATAVATAAEGTGLVVMEAFHYLYHPMLRRLLEVIRAGEIGDLVDLDVAFCVPMPPSDGNIRWNYALAGGTMMDLGSYAISFLRHVSGEEPTVTRADLRVARPDVDRLADAHLAFPSGASAHFVVSMWSRRLLVLKAVVRGAKGRIAVRFPFFPQVGGRILVTTAAGRRAETFPHRASYAYQLEAFRDAVLGGAPILTDATDAVANMSVIDAVYRAGGLPLRTPARA